MRQKVLKLTTLVNESLYVERSADRQLASIIDQMGRPGYILVARQMGKTNLLLNATRKHKSKHKFAYVDLSKSYNNVQSCFRNIIDIAIETNNDVFQSIHSQIVETRLKEDEKTQQIPAHKEHENELRLLLNSTDQNIIILLDEIDGLFATDFSDQVFAQIRSVYFSRINFEEYNRLTYILSGVAEPTSLIKNKAISPFNIGEKIYLNDFSLSEFMRFLKNAKLDCLDHEISLRIFDWAGGNARMTWDICSELENLLISGKHINSSDVDSIVKRLYLTDFDKAPIDHIRSLVARDSEIRNAIFQIGYNKGDTLSNDIRKKLYLSGIIAANYENSEIKIKNKILANCLSDEWLQELELKEKVATDQVEALFKAGNYAEVISQTIEVLKLPNLTQTQKRMCTNRLAYAYFKVNNFNEAIQNWKACLYDKTGFAHLYYEQIYHLGASYYVLKDYKSSISCFEEIYCNYKGNTIFLKAACFLSYALFTNDFDTNQNRIIVINEEVLECIKNNEQLNSDDIGFYKAITHFILGQAYYRSNELNEAQKHMHLASEFRDVEFWPNIIYELALCSKSDDDKKRWLNLLVDNILDRKLNPVENHVAVFYFGIKTFYNILVELFLIETEGFNKLFTYAKEHVEHENISENRLLYNLGLHAFQTNRISVGKALDLQVIIKYKEFNDSNLISLCYRDLVRFCAAEPEYLEFKERYIDLICKSEKIDKLDLALFANFIVKAIKAGYYKEALNLTQIIKRFYESSDENTSAEFAPIFYSEMAAYGLLQQKSEELASARRFLKFSEERNHIFKDHKPFQLFKQRAFNVVNKSNRESLKIYLDVKANTDTVNKKIGPNEKVEVMYHDGRKITGKYKKLKADIESGICRLL